MRGISLVLSVLALTVGAKSSLAEVSEDVIRNSYHEKAAITQLLRWYQYYENTDVAIANQLDILTEDFTVTSPSGTAEGRDQYEVAVKQFPSDWQNAHDLKDVAVTLTEDGSLNLTAQIVFANIGIAEGGALTAMRMGYEATLAYGDDVLPLFTDITITALGTTDVGSFADTYVENRLRSLVSYWITLVEHPDRNPEPFREILAPELDIRFSAGGDTYTSYEDIAAWVAGPVSSLPATRHVIGPITYVDLGDGRYELQVGFDWQGIRPDDKRMTAKTKHTWVVSDDPAERFARVERIRVETIEPFTVVE